MRQCGFEFAQATSQRGRVQAKVRHGLVYLGLDVPHDEVLLAWAATPFKAQAGHVTFFADDQRTARETLSFTAGQCVSYSEAFTAGDADEGAYLCQLTIATEHLMLAPGGPARAVVAPAAQIMPMAREALMQLPIGGQDIGQPAIASVASAKVEQQVIASPQQPTKQQVARLAALRRTHKKQGLTGVEEAEAVTLLATVLGIHTQQLNQLTPKPKHAPVPTKWQSKGGKIDILSSGYWQYTDWEGNSVSYEPDEPNFDAYARQEVDIEDMQGDCSSDFVKANAGAPEGIKKDTNTWHHKNNLRTMQEVPRVIHDRFTHYGARSIIRKRKIALSPAATVVNNAPVIRKRKR